MGIQLNQNQIKETFGTNLVGAQWQSRFMSKSAVQKIRTDPSFARDAFENGTSDLVSQWQSSQQLGLSRYAVASGIPSGDISGVLQLAPEIFTIAGAVASSCSRPDLGCESAIAKGIAKVGIGAAVTIISATGVGGAIASAIVGIVSALSTLALSEPERIRRELPEPEDYDDALDEEWVNGQILPRLTTFDWTSIYLPRFSGPWRIQIRKEGKYVIRPSQSLGPNVGAGMMPGTQRMDAGVQLFRTDNNKCDTRVCFGSQNIGSFYPGSAQMCTQLTEIVAFPQSQLYNIDTVRIRQAWREYFEGALDIANRIYDGDKATLIGAGWLGMASSKVRQDFARRFLAQYYVGGGMRFDAPGMTALNKKWDDNIRLAFEDIIEPWCRKVEQRQRHYLGTIVGAAYTAPNQAAFADNQSLSKKLEQMRFELLQHPARRNVVREDILRSNDFVTVDPSFSQALFDSTVGQTFGSEAPRLSSSEPFTEDPTPNADPGPPQGGAPFAPPRSGAGALALAAVAAALLIRG